MASPLELSSARQRSWVRSIGITSLVVILSLTLAGQYFWRYMPLYSQLENYRAYYLLACEYVSCQIPNYTNIDAIRSDNLAVRSHPTTENALAIAVSFRNSSSFAQTFPVMILSFNSADNEVIALREFSPEQYLDPSLRGFSQMPPNTPVQVELEIMDPGPFAVNYTLAFRLP